MVIWGLVKQDIVKTPKCTCPNCIKATRSSQANVYFNQAGAIVNDFFVIGVIVSHHRLLERLNH